MTALVEVRAAPLSEKSDLWTMYQQYALSLASMANIVPVDGVIADPRFDLYWTETGRWPFWGVVNGNRTGFALVNFDRSQNAMRMAEFYVLPECRRSGTGTAFAHELLARFPGPWRIRQIAANTAAVAFWRRVADPYGYSEASFTDRGIDRIEQILTVS